MGRLSEHFYGGDSYQSRRGTSRAWTVNWRLLPRSCQTISGIALEELATRCSASQAGVSARLRDLRKAKFGSQTIEKRYVANGLWVYRLSARQA